MIYSTQSTWYISQDLCLPPLLFLEKDHLNFLPITPPTTLSVCVYTVAVIVQNAYSRLDVGILLIAEREGIYMSAANLKDMLNSTCAQRQIYGDRKTKYLYFLPILNDVPVLFDQTKYRFNIDLNAYNRNKKCFRIILLRT